MMDGGMDKIGFVNRLKSLIHVIVMDLIIQAIFSASLAGIPTFIARA
jgi:hypothetical protein